MEKELQHLLTQVSTISKKYDEIAEITGENFNIFKILKMETKEVKTHSAFLAELLNPKGSHGQGDVFLKLFIEEVREWENSRENISYNKKFELFDFNTSIAKANVEFYIGQTTDTEGGRIDILIESNPNKIIIENKIHAKDQPFQLLRYKNYGENAPLFYLTLWQWQEPSPNSKESLKEFTDYKRISYENEIYNWLEKCREKAVNHSLLRESITQYIYLIKYLTGKTLYKKMANNLVETILRTEDNLKSYYEIRKIQEKAIEEALLEKLKKELTRFANKKGFDEVKNSKGYLNFTNKFLEKNKLSISFEFEFDKYDSLFFGFYKEPYNQNAIITNIDNEFMYKFNVIETSIYFDDKKKWGQEEFIKIQNGEMAESIEEKLTILFDIADKEAEKSNYRTV